MGNIELEDRKFPISISLSQKSWKKIDEFMHKNGNGMNRSQFFETISTWYIDERQNPGQKCMGMFTPRQISNYFEDLERYLRLCDKEEVHKLLPIIRHANQLAQNLTRKVRRDLSKITDRDPTEKIRLENTRKAHEYRDKHEGAAAIATETETELVAPTPTAIPTFTLELEPLESRPRPRPKPELKVESNIDIEIIEDEVPNPYGKGEKVFQ